MSSFWFVIKRKLTTKEISIFSNSSHFEWRAGLSDTILKGDNPRTIPAKFALIWFWGFNGRTTTDTKWWPGELKKQYLYWMKNKISIYPPNMRNYEIWAPFWNKIAIFLKGPPITISHSPSSMHPCSCYASNIDQKGIFFTSKHANSHTLCIF